MPLVSLVVRFFRALRGKAVMPLDKFVAAAMMMADVKESPMAQSIPHAHRARVPIVIGISVAALLIASALGPPVSGQGQSRTEWRDYAGGPDGSRFMSSKQITKS